jgi:antirestriction protein
MTMTEQDTTPRIYVASLSDYNTGRLHGRWIDATQDAEDIAAEVHAMLASSPEHGAEEWAIHDFENFAGIHLGEWESFETVATVAQLLEEHGAAFAAWYSNESRDIADDLGSMFEEEYAGEWSSVADYAEELAEDMGGVPDDLSWPLSCIDWERAGRELELGGDIWTVQTADFGVYVFRGV